ncbi:hypothetical protein PTKIN_Ptkin14bG0041900 [Pterospermum kingtungense]
MIPSLFHNRLLISLMLINIFWILATVQAQDQYVLAIWYDKTQEKTIVWYANRGDPVTGRESKVELISTGHLVLEDAQGRELWSSERLTKDSNVSHAAMLDTGNFVIASKNSGNIWESFKFPTDTILPGQELDADNGGLLLSALAEKSYSKGKYQLGFNGGSLVLNKVDMSTRKPYSRPYFRSEITGSWLIFNESGHIQMRNSTGCLLELAPSNTYPSPDSHYYRATLNFYGVFTLYSYPKNNPKSESWSVLWYAPVDICMGFVSVISEDETVTKGAGPCGYNSICEPLKNDGRPNCSCPLGYSFLDENNPYIGCKQDHTSFPFDCNLDGSTTEEGRFEFKQISYVDFPYGDYAVSKQTTELECKQSCLDDCSCAVAIFRDPAVAEEGSGTCWKKKLPLSNGHFSKEIYRTVLFKVPKSNGSSTNPGPADPRVENRNQIILILSVLLGTSASFNLFSLIAMSLIFFCLYQRRLRDLNGISSGGDLETNLRSFTYKDLEQATNSFKEEIGRGAFGTVYKGELTSRYGLHVAVKKLEKLAQEGEKEFKTEVEVIGQTHHKNLVRLLGYCNEGEHRLLVYEFMGNGSLSSFLFGMLRPSWERRLQIASGIAKGLTYLHEECSTQIIHCDIKPQNILLDDSLNAKISDFGLAKLLINNKTQTQTGIRGTKGYVAPEWFRNTPVTVKVDVYSFGVMLLEIICCKKCVHVEMEEAAILTEWAVECYKSGTIEKLVENDEEAISDVGKLEMLLKVAIWCVQEIPSLRPSMRTVTMMLEGAVLVPPPPYPFLVDSMSGSGMM